MAEKKIIKFEQPADFFYRSAQKMMDGGAFINALNTIRRAVEIEPDNAEFSLCLAEVLTELARYEESNSVLFELLKNRTEADADCYFCLGCNFMGLNDVDKARESFEKYMQIDPDGEYSEEVEDFLYYFDSEEENIRELIDELNGDGIYKKAYEGKKHLDNAEFEKAVEVLESIEDDAEDISYAKNNLALAYYCLKDVDKAIDITSKVLKNNKNNCTPIAIWRSF
jgi:tetratricopeptide (TPR) repeat protein